MNETITLPMDPTTFGLLVAGAGLCVLVAVVYLALHRLGDSYQAPIWERLSAGWLAVLVPLAVLWVGLFLLTVAAVYSGLWQTMATDGREPASLGLGALLAALLGAPFVIWGTVLKYQTVSFQKESHITDRINKAVEQLGAEKSVSRIGRSVKIWTGVSSTATWETTESRPKLKERQAIESTTPTSLWHEDADVEERLINGFGYAEMAA